MALSKCFAWAWLISVAIIVVGGILATYIYIAIADPWYFGFAMCLFTVVTITYYSIKRVCQP